MGNSIEVFITNAEGVVTSVTQKLHTRHIIIEVPKEKMAYGFHHEFIHPSIGDFLRISGSGIVESNDLNIPIHKIYNPINGVNKSGWKYLEIIDIGITLKILNPEFCDDARKVMKKLLKLLNEEKESKNQEFISELLIDLNIITSKVKDF